MRFRIVRAKNRHIAIETEPFLDEKLSLKAKGLYIFLLCYHEAFPNDSEVASLCGISIEEVESLLKELNKADYGLTFYV